ncbi:hypothetical protein WJX77_001594 [Trebouxia sp. C0004]
MVKGNKFKTPEFLQKQALKAKIKPQPVTAAPVTSNKLHTVHQIHPPQQADDQQSKTLGTKPEALAELSYVSPVSATEGSAKSTKKQNKRKVNQNRTAITDEMQDLASPHAPVVKKQKLSKQAAAVPTILTAPAPQGKAINSNWAALKGIVTSSAPRRQTAKGKPAADRPPVLKAPQQVGTRAGVTPVVAIDCEMVGVGPDGTRSALARICMVNNDGGVLIDQYVQPQEKVTDYRTFVSGIEPKHLKDGAVSLSEAQKMVAQILTGRILVGHSVHHDLQALLLSHPRKITRDTATYPPLMMSVGKGQKAKSRSLRHLAETELGLSIQAGEHSPIDDARSTLYLYHKHRKNWEHHLQHGTLKDLVAPRLQKKIVLQQVEEAAAAGVDAAIIKNPTNGRKQQSLAQLAKHDSMNAVPGTTQSAIRNRPYAICRELVTQRIASSTAAVKKCQAASQKISAKRYLETAKRLTGTAPEENGLFVLCMTSSNGTYRQVG